MLFFTDLDRTIIYSKRFIQGPEDRAVLVESDGEKEIAFMTAGGLTLLHELAAAMPVIPVTTRNYRECQRINLLGELNLRYLIINNGAEIFCDGKRDDDYCDRIKREIGSLTYGFDEALEIFFDTFGRQDVKLCRLSDDFLWLVVMNSADFNHPLLCEINNRMRSGGWTVSATGRKIYLIPSVISKWRAVRYLSEKLDCGPVVCAGDSLMDKEMVENADVGIVPRGSELCNMLPGAIKTACPGVRAGEQILNIAKQIFEGI